MKASSVYIIAEAGVNHNGSLDLAKELVKAAAEIGADAIKFQTFKAENIVTKSAQRADYQNENCADTDSQYEMIKKLELSDEEFKTLLQHSKDLKIDFLSSPFDLTSIDFLHGIGMDVFKVPSGEITNLPYLRLLAAKAKEVILSTGMSTIDEVRDALAVLENSNISKITLLHATTEYPCPPDEVNLLAMKSLHQKFNLDVGYSDHTQGIEIPIAAAALGAKVIEKHFTLDNSMQGPDHRASLNVEDFSSMVNAVRLIERALGDGEKAPTSSELRNIPIVRKSIVAKKRIEIGEVFSSENITTKRPGSGLNPMKNWDSILGTVSKKSYDADELI